MLIHRGAISLLPLWRISTDVSSYFMLIRRILNFYLSSITFYVKAIEYFGFLKRRKKDSNLSNYYIIKTYEN